MGSNFLKEVAVSMRGSCNQHKIRPSYGFASVCSDAEVQKHIAEPEPLSERNDAIRVRLLTGVRVSQVNAGPEGFHRAPTTSGVGLHKQILIPFLGATRQDMHAQILPFSTEPPSGSRADAAPANNAHAQRSVEVGALANSHAAAAVVLARLSRLEGVGVASRHCAGKLLRSVGFHKRMKK